MKNRNFHFSKIGEVMKLLRSIPELNSFQLGTSWPSVVPMNHCPHDPIGIDAVPEQCFFVHRKRSLGGKTTQEVKVSGAASGCIL